MGTIVLAVLRFSGAYGERAGIPCVICQSVNIITLLLPPVDTWLARSPVLPKFLMVIYHY